MHWSRMTIMDSVAPLYLVALFPTFSLSWFCLSDHLPFVHFWISNMCPNCPHFFQWLKYHYSQQGLWERTLEAMLVTVLVGPLMISGSMFSFQLLSRARALWVPQRVALAADNQKGNLIRLEKHFASCPISSSLEWCLLSHSGIRKLLILRWLPNLEFFIL